MSYSKKYSYNDKRFQDLSPGELSELLPQYKDLHEKLKELMPDGSGTLELKNLNDTPEYRFNDGEYMPIEHLYSLTTDIETSLPSGTYYHFQFKADPHSKVNTTKAFKYSIRINKSDDPNTHFDESLDLQELAMLFMERFGVTENDLLKHLARLDLGTFQIDLIKEGESFKINRLYLAQAPSGKEDFRQKYENNIAKLEKEIVGLNEIIKENKEKIEELHAKVFQYDQLVEDRQKYHELLDKLGLKREQEAGIEDIKMAAQKNKINTHITGILEDRIKKDLTIIGADRSAVSNASKMIKSLVNEYFYDLNDAEKLQALQSVRIAKDLENKDNKLYEKYKELGADRILYYFSSPEIRNSGINRNVQDIMQHYELEFFEIAPGAPALVNECRFVGVKESQYIRGNCVETVALGIRNTISKQVIYKADVIVST